ncbi:DUF4175 family protein [Aquisphaera insulae]|uniref:DUF4175 family protein n=1 Tax=Aquisphaera insulae TaxID=2712864 RepID=UPI0013EABC03|nr:DUF4175 family protein [Aquisphaera insulae]
MTTEPETLTVEPDSLREEQARLRAWLSRKRRALGFEMALEFALDAAAAIVALGAVLVALDYWLRLGLSSRQVLLGVTLAGLAIALAIRLVPRFRAATLDDLSLAMTLDRVRPGIGQQVADVLQLPGLLRQEKTAESPALVRLAVRRALESLAAADRQTRWNWARTAGRGLLFLGALAIPVAFALIAPSAARLSLARWLRGSDERWPQGTYLTLTGVGDDGSLLAPRDEPFAVEVRADLPDLRPRDDRWVLPDRGEPFSMRKKPGPPVVPPSVRLRERTAEGAVRDAVMTAVAPGVFRHELPPSSDSSTFELTGGDDWLGPIRIERADRPTLQATRLRVRDPGAAKGEFRAVEDPAESLLFLPDTEVEMTLVGSEPIDRTRLDVHPGEPPALERVDPKSFAARWTLREATTLEIQLTSSGTGLASRPTFLSLGLLKDRVPRVTLRAQGVGAHVTPVATIPLAMAATDDLGLASTRLQVERTSHAEGKAEPVVSKQTVPLPLPAGGKAVLDHQARHDLDLQPSPPPIGTVLRIQAEVEDRCARGAQVGRSGVVHLQVVSADELFYEILIRQRAERSRFLATVEATEKQAPVLASNTSSEDYMNVLRALHTSSRQLDQVAGRIADTLQEMKLNEVGSPKSHRLLQDGIIDPIRELNAGPVAELRGVLQALGGGTRVQSDVEKARRLHGEVVARMKTILEQMSQWESFVDVVNQVAEVIKIQQKVLKDTEDARETRTKEVFDEVKP